MRGGVERGLLYMIVGFNHLVIPKEAICLALQKSPFVRKGLPIFRHPQVVLF